MIVKDFGCLLLDKPWPGLQTDDFSVLSDWFQESVRLTRALTIIISKTYPILEDWDSHYSNK